MKKNNDFTYKQPILKGFALLLSLTLMTVSCASGAEQPAPVQSGAGMMETATPLSVSNAAPAQAPSNAPILTLESYNAGFRPMETPYEPVEMNPDVKSYSVLPDLSNIANLSDYPNLTEAQKEKIAENSFVVVPTEKEQLFYIYEDNEYKLFSGFVTVDSVLQVYHIFFDYALRISETEEFYPALQELNGSLLQNLVSYYVQAGTGQGMIKDELEKAIGYFGVASMLMGDGLPAETPVSARERIGAELERIQEGAEAISPLMGILLDYSQFTVRGHYTRSDTLTKYFQAMMWYGQIPFRLYDEFGERDLSSTLCSLVITWALFDMPDGPERWESIYSPSCFFVGNSDDITPFQFKAVMDKAYGADVKLDGLLDQDSLDAFYREADKLPKPRINTKRTENKDTAQGLQFRFMGQRYILDSEILQELSQSIVRPVPTGLDVLSVLGSDRASDLNERYYEPAKLWPDYTDKFQELREIFAEAAESVWQSNLYNGWLWTLQSLTDEYGEGYPAFMQNVAWLDKSLATALGSWAQLRHDTILYGKQGGAEKGGGDVVVPPSYVEPNPELYNKLLWLVRYSKENLLARKMLNDKVLEKMEGFESLLDVLLQLSIKELRGEALTEDENRWIMSYGGRLEHLTTSFAEGDIFYWYEIESDADRNMALIADVFTLFANPLYPVSEFLEEAVGHAAEIYVAVPVGDEIYLARGAVFDYYEFLSDKRLTDEEWQAMLKSGEGPERPEWVWSFMGEKAQ